MKWHLFELVLGKVLLQNVVKGAIVCSTENGKWIHRTWKGMFFLMLHILGTMQSTVMCKTVFIKNPKSVGFFDGMDDSKESKKKK